MKRASTAAAWSALIVFSGCRFGYEQLPLAFDAGGAGGAGTLASGGTAAGGGGSSVAGAALQGGAGVVVGGSTPSGGAPDTAGTGPTTSGGVGDAGASSATGGAGNPAGLVAYWPLNESTGLVAVDASGNGNDGTLIGFTSTGWSAGHLGGALTFSVDRYVEVPPSSSIDGIADRDQLSIAAWVSVAKSSPGFASILSVQLGSSNQETFGLYLNNTDVVVVVNSDGASHECYGAAPGPMNTFFHVAGTFDGSVARVFVDGQERCNVIPDVLDIPSSSNPLWIGANRNGATPGEYLEAALDELVLYDRALSAAEITGLAAGGPPP